MNKKDHHKGINALSTFKLLQYPLKTHVGTGRTYKIQTGRPRPKSRPGPLHFEADMLTSAVPPLRHRMFLFFYFNADNIYIKIKIRWNTQLFPHCNFSTQNVVFVYTEHSVPNGCLWDRLTYRLQHNPPEIHIKKRSIHTLSYSLDGPVSHILWRWNPQSGQLHWMIEDAIFTIQSRFSLLYCLMNSCLDIQFLRSHLDCRL